MRSWRDPSAARRPRRRADRRDDARGEGRPALRRLGRRLRRRRRRRPAPARHDRRRSTSTTLLPRRTRPADPAVRHRPGRSRRSARSRSLRTQQRIVAANRFGIPALAHEECLAGLRRLGRHRLPGAAVLGRDLRPRAGRADGAPDRRRHARRSASTRASPPCSTSCATRAGAGSRRPSARTRTWSAPIGTAYVRGLESAGVVATLKHFVGYSASRGRPQPRARLDRARASSPTCCCRRSRWRSARAAPRSVMHSYTDIDGVPVGRRRARCSPSCCATRGASTAPSSPTTSASRFLAAAARRRRHDWARPPRSRSPPASTSNCRPCTATASRCVAAVRDGRRRRGARRPRPAPGAARRRPSSACSTRLVAVPAALADADLADAEALRGTVDLDPPATARSPASSPSRRSSCCATTARCRSRRPRADRGGRPERRRPAARCSAATPSPRTSASQHPERRARHRASRPCSTRCAARVPRRARSLRAGHDVDGRRDRRHRRGRRRGRGTPTSCVVALGDRAGLFGRGTSGEGCDAESLDLPGAQQQLLDAVLDTGTPSVLTLLAGRPYALGPRGRRRPPRSCRRSSPARRARRRSPAC